VAEEMLRVLKPDDCFVWYDFYFNNPFNRDVCGLRKRNSPALPQLSLLLSAGHFGAANCPCRPVSPALCGLLSSLKVFSAHYLVLITSTEQ
jgi:hypothetical protein